MCACVLLSGDNIIKNRRVDFLGSSPPMNMNWWINKKMGGARQFNSTKWWYTYSFKWWASVLSTQIHSILNPLRSIIKYPYSTYACKPNLNYSFSITEVKVQLWQWIFYFFLAPPPLNWDKKKNRKRPQAACSENSTSIMPHLYCNIFPSCVRLPNAGRHFFFPPPAFQSAAAPTTWHKRHTNVALIAAQREAESPLGARFSENLIVWTGPEWTNYPHAVFPSQSCVI